MAGMTSIYVGVSGLQSSQTSLNTTSHNLSNVYTKGYTRQISFTADRTYNTIGQSATGLKQVGLGVTSSSTSRVRDILLDAHYRKENGREGFYSAQYEAITEIETILGETEGTKFQDSLENLWSAIGEMAKTPGSDVSRSELVMNSETFITRAKEIYQSMVDYQKNLDTKVSETVDKINKLGDQIKHLNDKISGIEVTVESANDLRDQRDVALDELSKLVKISYEEDENNLVYVKVEGTPFVTEGAVFHMATKQLDGDKNSTYLSCVWPHIDNQEVFNLEEKVDAAIGNDSGSLKGYVLARGDYAANYTDIPKTENFDMTTSQGRKDYEDAVVKYNKNIANCSVAKSMAMFDSLINGIVTKINDVISPTKTGLPAGVTVLTDADGNEYKSDSVRMLDTSTSTGDDGKMPPQEIFSRKETKRFIEVTGDDGKTYYMFNEKNVFGKESLYTCSNIEMNQTILEDYSKLPFKTLEGDTDMQKGQQLVDEWKIPQTNLSPDAMTKLTFKEYYHQFVYDIGNQGSLCSDISKSQAIAAAQIDDARTEITGVSSNDELANMIKFQSAYNASSRYVSTVADMLEYIIEKLG